MPLAGVVIGASDALHNLVIVAAEWLVGEVSDLMLHVHLLAFQQKIDNLSQPHISRAKPSQVAIFVLGLGMHPEQIALRARREHQLEDTAIRSALASRLVWGEASI